MVCFSPDHSVTPQTSMLELVKSCVPHTELQKRNEIQRKRLCMEKVVMWKTVKEATKEEKLETKKGKRRGEETHECKIKIQCASTEL